MLYFVLYGILIKKKFVFFVLELFWSIRFVWMVLFRMDWIVRVMMWGYLIMLLVYIFCILEVIISVFKVKGVCLSF